MRDTRTIYRCRVCKAVHSRPMKACQACGKRLTVAPSKGIAETIAQAVHGSIEAEPQQQTLFPSAH